MNKIKKLNYSGFSHEVAFLAIVLVFAVVGVGYLVASHADSPAVSTTSSSSSNGILAGWTRIGAASASSLYTVKSPPPSNEQPNMTLYACKVTLSSSSLDVSFMAALGYGVPLGVSNNWFDDMDLSSSPLKNNVVQNTAGNYFLSNNSWDKNNYGNNARYSASKTFPTVYESSTDKYYVWGQASYQNTLQHDLVYHPDITNLADCQK